MTGNASHSSSEFPFPQNVDAKEPRIPLVLPNEMDDEQRSLITDQQAQLSLFQLLAHHPEALRRLKAVGSFANRDTALPLRDRELMVLRISWLYQSEFEWGQHHQTALDAGWTVEDCERVKLGPAVDGWDDRARAVLRATDGLVTSATIPDDAWEFLLAEYGEERMLELVIFFGHYTMVSMFANTFRLPCPPGKQGFSRPTP